MCPVLVADRSTNLPAPDAPPAGDRPSPGSVVELFAGVGGFHLGLTRELVGQTDAGGWDWSSPDVPDWELAWGNQWEPSTKSQPAFTTYQRHVTTGHLVNRDVAQVLDDAGVPLFDGGDPNPGELNDPDAPPATFDLLVGGYPCQDYSIAKPLSVSGGLGGGRGVLWWQVARILQHFRPQQVLLENVDRLLSSPASRRGRDFAVTLACFGMLGYRVEWRVINAADYGMPTRRRRTFIYATYDPDGALGLPGQDALEEGIFSTTFPATFTDAKVRDLTFFGQLDAHEVSEAYTDGAWPHAGVFADGVAYAASPTPDSSVRPVTLAEILLPPDEVDDNLWLDAASQERWEYLKGAKREERIKVLDDGTESPWVYSEGGMAFPDPVDRPARTVLTSEGGRSPSRTTHVVSQAGRLRRLDPVELERIMMFPDGWTDELSHTKRAFTMGNALVVGVVAALSPAIAARRTTMASTAR